MDYKKYLLDDILAFWSKDAIDNENGGIFTFLDEEGNIYGEEKSCWFQGRALWIFSKAYNSVEKREDLLKIATKIFNFLPLITREGGRMPFSVTKKGETIQQRRYYFSETFAAIGCAEYYKATKNEKVWEMAEMYFDIAYDLYSNPSKTIPKFNPETSPYKALSPIMILLNTALILKSTKKNEKKYAQIVDTCLEEILHGGYINYELGAVLEQVTLDGKFFDSPQTRVVNPGHSLECAWFLMSSGKEEAIKAGKNIIDFTMPRGIDKEHGGVIAFTDVSGKPPLALEWDMKLWWPQCEAIIANKMAYDIFKEDKYKKAYEDLLEYVFKYFADEKNGEWYGYLHYDNSVANVLKGNMFKGPFHIPRLFIYLSTGEIV